MIGSEKNSVHQLDIRSLGIAVSFTILNAKYNLLMDRGSFNLYDIKLIDFSTVYDSKC